MEIQYLGHSAVRIKVNNEVILIDPFLVKSPNYSPKQDDIKNILVTHAHSDHIGSAVEISKLKNAPTVAIFEIANKLASFGLQTMGLNFGGWVNFSWGKCMFLPACHTSSFSDGSYGGEASGILFDIEGKLIYHSGDTSLSQEFKTLREYGELDLIFVPVGGFYTMGINEAIMASKWSGAKKIVPIHYNTFDAIKVNIEEFQSKAKENGLDCNILHPEEKLEL